MTRWAWLAGVLLTACVHHAPPAPLPPPVTTTTTTSIPVPPPAPPFPPMPTRREVLTSRMTFQGLQVTCDGYGTLPWFEVAISTVDANCRQHVYAAKHAAGDTAVGLAVSWNYKNDNNFSYPVDGTDLTTDYPRLRSLVEEVVRAGFTPWIFLAGDGESRPDCSYNDPNGWTYGYPCVTQHILPAVVQALDGVNDRVLYVVGFDGVFYGLTPDEIAAVGISFRSLLPNGYLAIEHNQGHIPVGNGQSDYASGGKMTTYDVVLGEFNNWPTTGDVVWQILGRMLGPAYRRDPAQPPGDDPAPPWYLDAPTSRGPYVYHCFEYALYDYVRGRIGAVEVTRARTYYQSLGCAVVD